MLAKRIIPCLDVRGGRVVKGVHFIDIRDAGDPVESARAYNAAGADELVFLDISATLEDRGILLDVVHQVAEQVFIPFTVGGGIRTLEDIRAILQAGADKISLNSAAVLNPELVRTAAGRFGSQCIVVAIDVRRSQAGRFEVMIAGGTQRTGLDAVAWARRVEELGAGEILLTSMDRDGTKSPAMIWKSPEPDRRCRQNAGYRLRRRRQPRRFLRRDWSHGGAEAVLAASLFHFNQISDQRSSRTYLALRGIPMRPSSPDRLPKIWSSYPAAFHDTGLRSGQQRRPPSARSGNI